MNSAYQTQVLSLTLFLKKKKSNQHFIDLYILQQIDVLCNFFKRVTLLFFCFIGSEEVARTDDSRTGGTIWVKTKPFKTPKCKEGI